MGKLGKSPRTIQLIFGLSTLARVQRTRKREFVCLRFAAPSCLCVCVYRWASVSGCQGAIVLLKCFSSERKLVCLFSPFFPLLISSALFCCFFYCFICVCFPLAHSSVVLTFLCACTCRVAPGGPFPHFLIALPTEDEMYEDVIVPLIALGAGSALGRVAEKLLIYLSFHVIFPPTPGAAFHLYAASERGKTADPMRCKRCTTRYSIAIAAAAADCCYSGA